MFACSQTLVIKNIKETFCAPEGFYRVCAQSVLECIGEAIRTGHHGMAAAVGSPAPEVMLLVTHF
jgi:hypothetical protein